MPPRFEDKLKCDTCGYEAKDWADADAHENANLDHWVQLIQVELKVNNGS